MNWHRSFSIVRKELWEYRRQKFILYSLLIPPMIFALVLPSVSFIPILGEVKHVDPILINEYKNSTSYPSPTIALDESNGQAYIRNHSVDGVAFISGARLRSMTVFGGHLNSCIASDCYISDFQVNGSALIDCTIVNGVVRGSLLINVTVRNAVIIECIGQNVTTVSSSVTDSKNLEIVSTDGLKLLDIAMLLLNTYTFLLILVPAITPTVIASYSFVGEKNNKSLEPLLATPATDRELLWGKILAIFIPTMATTVVGFVLFAVIGDLVFTSYIGAAPLPDDTWLVSLVLLAPMMCFLSITANVIISSRMSDVRASQQVGSLIILPLLLVLIGSLSGTLTFGATSLVAIGVILLVVDVAVYVLATKTFRRETILVKWK